MFDLLCWALVCWSRDKQRWISVAACACGCVCVCIYTCMRLCLCLIVYVNLCRPACLCVYVCMSVSLCVSVCRCASLCVSVCVPLSLSLSVSLCLFLSLTNARAQKKIEQEVERFLKSESATTSCSLVERIARTSGPAICRASNSNDYIYSRFKGTGLTLIGFERRPTKRSICEFF